MVFSSQKECIDDFFFVKSFKRTNIHFYWYTSINLDRILQNEFEGFEYINSLIMTDEIQV
jgi:hypothetical protein